MGDTANGKKRSDGKSHKGRPPGVKFTDEQKRQIISFVEAGGSVDAAAQAAGISRVKSTVLNVARPSSISR